MQTARVPARSKSSYLNPGRCITAAFFSVRIFVLRDLKPTVQYANPDEEYAIIIHLGPVLQTVIPQLLAKAHLYILYKKN